MFCSQYRANTSRSRSTVLSEDIYPDNSVGGSTMSSSSHVRNHGVIVDSIVMFRLDYGNALLAELPLEHLKKLQRIQNIAARIITFTARRDHITPILRQLHWLPIKRRIELKILLPVFRCMNGTAPLYLADILK